MSRTALTERRTLSPRNVADLLLCSESHVRSLADDGNLKHHKVPHRNGQFAREFYYDDVILFMRQSGYEVADVEAASVVVAIAGAPAHWSVRLLAAVKKSDYVLVRLASTGFEAGLLVGEKKPKAIVVDALMGRSEALLIVRAAAGRGVEVTAVIDEDDDRAGDFTAAGCRHVHRRPADPLAVLAQILTSLEPAHARPQ